MKTLIVLNDPAYGTERSYNGLRLAHALAERDGEQVRIFLLADAVTCALAGQTTPNGYYNLEKMLGQLSATAPRSDSAAAAWTHARSARSTSSTAAAARR